MFDSKSWSFKFIYPRLSLTRAGLKGPAAVWVNVDYDQMIEFKRLHKVPLQRFLIITFSSRFEIVLYMCSKLLKNGSVLNFTLLVVMLQLFVVFL